MTNDIIENLLEGEDHMAPEVGGQARARVAGRRAVQLNAGIPEELVGDAPHPLPLIQTNDSIDAFQRPT